MLDRKIKQEARPDVLFFCLTFFCHFSWRTQLMKQTLKHRALFVGILLCALAAPARGDEIQYLPDGCFLLFSADLSAFGKSKLYQEAKKQIHAFDEGYQNGLREQMGVPADNVAR